MTRRESSWDDDWLIMGPVIAFSIIGVVAGGLIGNNKGESIIYLILGVLIGGVCGFILGAMIGGFLDSIFGNDDEKSNQSFNSSKSNGTGDSQSWEKIADEFLKIIKDSNSAYTTLESTPQDDFDIIKRNYRRLLMEYHPDKLGSNASTSIQNHAKEMSQKLNEAYEIIKKQRGVK